MERPPDLFDREAEWQDLVGFVSQPGPGGRLALVHGRRRQGKSFLLRRLVAATGGFYYQALEEDRGQALASFGSALGTHLCVPGGPLRFDDWDRALRSATERDRPGGAPLVVIDELPYLLTHSPELPSVLQRLVDEARHRGPPFRLVVCGSALSVMAHLLSGSRALRGRASHDIVVRPFDYRSAARFWGIDDPGVAFMVHAVVGGTPGYRDLVPARSPRRRGDLARWLAEGPLNPSSALFREDAYLLTEERSLSDRALYHSVVGAIASGKTTQASIAAALGREQRAVQHPLHALEDAGFVTRQQDSLRARRPIYGLVDPIVRFHHVVTRKDLARFEDRRTAPAWADAEARFASHVLGPHLEQLARDFTLRFAASETLGANPASVGPAVVNDARGRARHQIDVVALGRERAGATPVLAIGEAKHSGSRLTTSDLDRLARIRLLIGEKHPTAAEAKLLLFSANGFDRNLTEAAAARPDVELIDLERMYVGS